MAHESQEYKAVKAIRFAVKYRMAKGMSEELAIKEVARKRHLSVPNIATAFAPARRMNLDKVRQVDNSIEPQTDLEKQAASLLAHYREIGMGLAAARNATAKKMRVTEDELDQLLFPMHGIAVVSQRILEASSGHVMLRRAGYSRASRVEIRQYTIAGCGERAAYREA